EVGHVQRERVKLPLAKYLSLRRGEFRFAIRIDWMHRAGRERGRKHAADELGIYGVAGEGIPAHRIAGGRRDRRGFRLVRLAHIETRSKIARRAIGSGSTFFVASIPTPIRATRNVPGSSAGGAAGPTVAPGCGGKA